MRHLRRHRYEEAELDITAFMNLMIVLVPILLLGMVFSRITVLGVVLPPIEPGDLSDDNAKAVELIIRDDGMRVDYCQKAHLWTFNETDKTWTPIPIWTGITDNLVRVAVGLEDVIDIQADLARGFAAL